MNKSYNIIVLGGTSAIALAYVKQRVSTLNNEGIDASVTLVARDDSKLNAECANLSVLGVNTKGVVADLSEANSKLCDKFEDPLDEVIIAYGILSEQDRAQSDLSYRDEQIAINFTSVAHWVELILARFENTRYGKLIVIGSVAGDRGRQSNYIYGACKSAIETLINGAQHRFYNEKNISILLVKPGFVDTPMTKHIENKGFLWAKPKNIAKDIEKGVLRGRRVIYTPWFWRIIMLIIISVPSFIFYRTKL